LSTDNIHRSWLVHHSFIKQASTKGSS